MRRLTSRYPRARSLFITTAMLRMIPGTDPTIYMRRSEKGVPNLRYESETNGLQWSVDIYRGHFYRARVGNGIGEVFHNSASVVGYLIRSLGLAEGI